ncbi:MAG: DUF6064 family protein [Betaproteobacteria bacterium]|nr:DUF6064 family protein [Betaproteobacteria bacterium]MDH5287688.1 DUF6064 family protein [Betaproteobacteria bacterium]
MPEWQTYSLADFLMFAPRTYWRLVELYNAGIWPAQAAVVAVGCAALLLAARGGGAAARLIPALLAAAWAWVAWGWLHSRFATINWPADYIAIAFAVEAALLAAFALRRGGLQDAARPVATRAGLVLAAFAVAAYPFTAPLAGRGMATAEVAGLMPDPTAIATLGFVLRASRGARLALLPIPLLACCASAAMHWTMGAALWWLPLVAAILAYGLALASGGRARPS